MQLLLLYLTMTCNQYLKTTMEIREITFSICVILGIDWQAMVQAVEFVF